MLRRMEVSEVRRRVRGVIDDAKRRAADRRARNDAATQAFAAFLTDAAAPAFHALAQALTGESYRFKVFTPGESVRLTPEFSQDEFVELSLDTTGDEPLVMLTVSRGRGRRQLVTERPLFNGRPLADVSQDDVIAAVLEALPPFVER
jgi:hypothetical protein